MCGAFLTFCGSTVDTLTPTVEGVHLVQRGFRKMVFDTPHNSMLIFLQILRHTIHHVCLYHPCETLSLLRGHGREGSVDDIPQHELCQALLPWHAHIISHPSSLTDYFEVRRKI